MRRPLVSLFLVSVAVLLLTGCPARIDSRNPEKRLQALAALTDQAELARIAKSDPSWKVRDAAWKKLTDQTLLTEMALAATGTRPPASRDIGLRAVARITDQSLLARIATGTKDSSTFEEALARITDQGLLADLVINETDLYSPTTVIGRITEPSLLVRLAMEAKHTSVRLNAVRRINDQSLLTRMAAQDSDHSVRNAALRRVTDAALLRAIVADSPMPEARGAAAVALARQSLKANEAAKPEHGVDWQNLRDISDPVLLARCALAKSHEGLRRDAVRLITNPALLALIADDGDRAAALTALEQIEDGDALAFLSRDGDAVVASIARLKLALRDPRIVTRHPRLRIEMTLTDRKRDYQTVTVRYRSGSPGDPVDAMLGRRPADAQVIGETKGRTLQVAGEVLHIVLRNDREKLADHGWAATFPTEFNLGGLLPHNPQENITADVRGEDLLAKLLGRPEFTPDDLAQIVRGSPFRELRIGAVRNLTDQALLASLATGKEDSDIRLVAISRLQNQEVLSAIATAVSEPMPHREAAIANLTDPALLARLASAEDGYQSKNVRLAAINRIDDQAVLARIAGGERDVEIRSAAFSRIRDRSTLERIAADQSKPEIAEEARLHLDSLKADTLPEPK